MGAMTYAREIMLEIGTAGRDPLGGDRIVEIGCAELVNSIPPGWTFHAYFNPRTTRPVDQGPSEKFLKDKPFFAELADDLLAFLGDLPLFIRKHSSEFTLGLLNAELKRAGRPQIAHERIMDTNDFYFGVCPVCHKTDGYANAGSSHRFYCKEHKTSWHVGANLFSSWKHETEEEQRKIWDEIGLDGFEDVVPYNGPPGLWNDDEGAVKLGLWKADKRAAQH